MNPTNTKEGQPVGAGLANETTNNAHTLAPMPCGASYDPKQAEAARDEGMARSLSAITDQDRTAITTALLTGFDPLVPKRAEDALAGFWPPSAPPRSLGAIISHLSRRGLIVESGWTKGRSGRSHAGRVSLWRLSKGGAP
jgi:hypothetical protein